MVTDIGTSEWLHLWIASIHNVTIRNNWADTKTFLNHGTECPMIDNTIFAPGAIPAAAQKIIDATGVTKENRFRH